eukprot:m51a1_g14415 hypothetical protein (306) ;mRNA; f:454794-456167
MKRVVGPIASAGPPLAKRSRASPAPLARAPSRLPASASAAASARKPSSLPFTSAARARSAQAASASGPRLTPALVLPAQHTGPCAPPAAPCRACAKSLLRKARSELAVAGFYDPRHAELRLRVAELRALIIGPDVAGVASAGGDAEMASDEGPEDVGAEHAGMRPRTLAAVAAYARQRPAPREWAERALRDIAAAQGAAPRDMASAVEALHAVTVQACVGGVFAGGDDREVVSRVAEALTRGWRLVLRLLDVRAGGLLPPRHEPLRPALLGAKRDVVRLAHATYRGYSLGQLDDAAEAFVDAFGL